MTTLRTDSLAVARARFEEAAEAFQDAGDLRGAIECRIEQARALGASFRKPDLDEAHQLLDGAERKLADRPDKGLAARLLHVRGYVQLRGGAFEDAIHTLRSAERAFREAGDKMGEARTLDTLGVLHERSNDGERAALCLAHSHALKQRLGDQHGVAISLGNLGRLALHGGKSGEAEGFFRLDLEIARELHDTRGEAVIRTNLAEALIAQGRAVEAARAANQALALSKQVGNEVGQGYARLVLSEVGRATGNEFTARDEAEQALACFERVGMRAGKAAARVALSRVESAEGNVRQASAVALAGAATARRAGHADMAVDAFLEAHTQLQAGALWSHARRALARAYDVAAMSHQTHLLDRVRSRQTAQDLSLALAPGTIRLDIEHAAGDLAGREGEALDLEVDGFLGTGAFASVFRVRDPQADRSYAWKQMHGGRERAAALATRLKREFGVLARVDTNPHLVRVHAFAHRDGAPGLLLDLVTAPGRHDTLQSAMDDMGRLPHDATIRMAREVALGLAALHAAGVVHRDVKPGNILFGPGGRAVLTDCGLAFDASDEAYVPVSTFAGSLAFAPPELATTGDAWTRPNASADCYALGVTLYRAITGKWPIPLEGDLAAVLKSKHENEPDILALPTQPDGLRRLVKRLCARDPELRPTAAETAEALRAMLSADGG